MRRVLLILMLLTPRAGFTWGMEGHRLVVRLAERWLDAQARARIAATLAPGESLEALASWADEVRAARKETAPWHYIDIPIHSSGLDMRRDCPESNCVVAKIASFRQIWADARESPASRREALLFLVHFVGDLHQPLHCADNGDQGGNKVRVRFLGEDTQLHALWDVGILNQMPAEDLLFAELVRAATPEQITAWSRGTVEQWADESFRVGVQTVYGLLPPAGADGVVVIGRSYEMTAEPVVERQLERAGARLAAILNQSAR